MPRYTFLWTDLRCPNCGNSISDLLWFGWGYSDAQQPVGDNEYRLGDAIRWRSCADGTTEAWANWPGAPYGMNMGDPTVLDIIVLDNWTEGNCAKCEHPTPGAAIEIRGGVIQRCWVVAPSEFNREIEYNLIEPDGSIRPMLEWSDNLVKNRLWHPVPEGC